MSRLLSGDLRIRLLDVSTSPVFLYYGVFSGTPVALWSGAGNLSWDSITWNGNGWLQGFDGGGEMDDLSAPSISVRLAGVPESIISLVLNASQGSEGRFYIGAMSASGTLVADPYLCFKGKLDVPTISARANDPQVTITYESRFLDLDRPREYRYTTESQKLFYPTDRGFEYVTAASKWAGFWGNKKNDAKKEKPAKQKKGSNR